MSEENTSGETSVASAGTQSAQPAAPAPIAFGTSRGSGLARGKRPGAQSSATATKDASPASYQPTAIQVIEHRREYKNPFAPEPAPVETPTAAPAPVAAQPEIPAPAAPVAVSAPVSETAAAVSTTTPAPVAAQSPAAVQTAEESKPQLKILPPEDNSRPPQRWEIGSEPEQTPNAQDAGFRPRREGRGNREARPDFKREGRPDFRAESRPESRGEGRTEPRGESRPESRGEGRTDYKGERRENRPEFRPSERREQKPAAQPQQTPVPGQKRSGFLGWLKGLFGGDTAEETPKQGAESRGQPAGERRPYEGGQGGQRRDRGGRGGRGGFRNDNRPQGGRTFEGGPRPEGGEANRYEGGGGGGPRRRRHRGGRGRFRGDGRPGDSRPDQGGPSGS